MINDDNDDSSEGGYEVATTARGVNRVGNVEAPDSECLLQVQPIKAPGYAVGDMIWYYCAAYLGGAAGTAALQPQWREHEVCGHVYQEGNFLLYEIIS